MASSPFSQLRFRLIFSTGWSLLITEHAIVLKGLGFSWQSSIIESLVSNILLLLPCLLMTNTLRFYLPRRERYLNILFWCVLLTLGWLALSRWLLILINGNNIEYTKFIDNSLVIRGGFGFLILGSVTLVSVLWFNWEEQKEMEKRKADAEKLSKDAELFKLRQQLQPHFLFNSLNSINALIGLKPEQARKMVQQLSDFLRGTLKKDEHQWVTLKEELQYLQLYLEIEKVRFGNRLKTETIAGEDAEQMRMPALLLQPIVENAIKFGLYDTTGETLISIRSMVNDQQLIITVENPFDPETSAPKYGTGFGLSSVQRRLDLLFARKDLLKKEIKENIFITTVVIPQPSEKDHSD